MIKVVEEPSVFFEETRVYEQCYFCKQETKFWHDATNTPVCQGCAKKYNVKDIKRK